MFLLGTHICNLSNSSTFYYFHCRGKRHQETSITSLVQSNLFPKFTWKSFVAETFSQNLCTSVIVAYNKYNNGPSSIILSASNYFNNYASNTYATHEKSTWVQIQPVSAYPRSLYLPATWIKILCGGEGPNNFHLKQQASNDGVVKLGQGCIPIIN